MLRIGEDYTIFKACSSQSDIFFDNLSNRICTVRGNGEMGITAKGLKENNVISFRVPDAGRIRSLNFSPDSQIVGIRRDSVSVDFAFLDGNGGAMIIKQACKRADGNVLGLQWVSDSQVLMICNEGLDLFTINTKRKLIKFTKCVNITTNWFISYDVSQMIFAASGISNSTLNPFIIQSNTIHTLSKFEVDFGCSALRPALLEKDITVSSIYERICVLVLKSGTKEAFTEKINIYEFSKHDAYATPQLTKTLRLYLTGLIAMHIVDNVILVHHKNSTSSLIYEVSTAYYEASETSSPPAVQSVREILPLCISNVELAENLKAKLSHDGDVNEISLYNSSSAVFSPNLMADIRLGIFTTLTLDMSRAVNFIKDKDLLIDFLLKRSNAEKIFLEIFKRCIMNRLLSISKICKIFHRILENCVNNATQNSDEKEIRSKCQLNYVKNVSLQIDHNTILRNVFDPLRDCENVDKKFLSYLVLEFLFIVKKMKIPLKENYLPEFLLKVLVDAKQYKKLQQLLQYGVIDDSKFLVNVTVPKNLKAYELISLHGECEPLHQMAIDMLARRENVEQIAEILLAKGRVIEAMRCLALENRYRNTTTLDRIQHLKLLESAWKTKNRHIMFTVFFHLRYIHKSRFFDGTHEGFDMYIKDFGLLFKDEEIEEAEKRFRLARISSVGRKTGDRLEINDDTSNEESSDNTPPDTASNDAVLLNAEEQKL